MGASYGFMTSLISQEELFLVPFAQMATALLSDQCMVQ
jgi:hypothetical protein